ncbi:hypothetical protein CLV51_10232 [Chitinophaga niastensis]|uniref:Uncharacterized protein n=1 Tax=Chitinophaga niastensis TaxID=536980 RepID=A0A2P8HLV5_CHINA|nr:hypothetical protein CLV51_10232 [Chitinophaga niastensis]
MSIASFFILILDGKWGQRFNGRGEIGQINLLRYKNFSIPV